MQFTSVVSLLTTVSALTLGATAGGFAATCTNFFIQNNHFLVATCGNGSGGQTTSSLDLNACIGIGSGSNLNCVPNGNYAALGGCAGCEIRTGAFMQCGCPGAVRIGDLNECVTNNHGLLTC